MYAVKGLFEIDEVNCKGLLELLALFKYIPKSEDLFVAGSATAEACLFLSKMAVVLGFHAVKDHGAKHFAWNRQ